MPNSTHWQQKHCTLHVTLCTTLFVRHFPYVTFHPSPSARQSLHITLCKSPSARHSLASRPLHVTPYTSLPTRRSLIAAPSPSSSGKGAEFQHACYRCQHACYGPNMRFCKNHMSTLVAEFSMMLQNSNMMLQNFNMAFQTSEHGVSKLRTCMLQI